MRPAALSSGGRPKARLGSTNPGPSTPCRRSELYRLNSCHPGVAFGGHAKPGHHFRRRVLVFAPSAPLNFTNAAFIRGRLISAVERAPKPVRLVVIEASGVTDIDYTGANMLRQVVQTLRAKGIQVALARLSSERASEHAARTGLLDAFGAERVFRSVEDAVRSFKASPG